MAASVASAPSLRDLPSSLPFDDYDISTRVARDHEVFRDLYITCVSPGVTPAEKLAAVHDLVRAVTLHANSEEMVLYALARAFLPEGAHTTDRDIEFHARLPHELSSLTWSTAEPHVLEQKLARAWSTLSAHMEEEETILLPALVRYVPLERRVAAGRLFSSVKLLSCSRPHVAAPTMPPLNVVANALTAPLDWALDMWRFENAPPL